MKKRVSLSMTEGPLAMPMIRLAIPLALTGILLQCFNTTDTLILGQYVGSTALAAMGNNEPLVALMVNLFMGLSLGANVVIAQLLGARRYMEANLAIHTALCISLLWGIGVMVLGEIGSGAALTWLQVPEEVMSDAETYLRIYLLSLPGVSLYNFEAAIYRSKGNTRMPLLAIGVAGIMNFFLDLISVWMGFGLAGVAWATVAATYVGAFLLLYTLEREHGVLRVYLGALKFHKRFGREILRIGVPAGVQGMVFALANVVFQSAINSLGSKVMAASAAALVLELNTYCFCFAFGQTMTTFISQNYGAQNEERCNEISKKGILLFSACNLFLSLSVALMARPLLSLFDLKGDEIEIGVIRVYYIIGFYLICGMIDLISGVLRGYGYSLPPAMAMLVTICGFRVVYAYTVFPAVPTFDTIMLCYPLSWSITVAVLAIILPYYRKYKIHFGNVHIS